MQVRPEDDERKLYKFTVEYKDSEGKKRTQSGRVWTATPAQFRKALLTRYDIPGTREILFITMVECEPAVGEEPLPRSNVPAVITAPQPAVDQKFYEKFCDKAWAPKNVPCFFEKELNLFREIAIVPTTTKEVKTI